MGRFTGGLVTNYADGGSIHELGASAAQALFAENKASGTKPVLAALTPGEYVINRDQVKSLLESGQKPYQLQDINNLSAYSGANVGGGNSNSQTNNQQSYAVHNNWNINYDHNNPNSMSDSQVRNYNEAQAQRTFKRFGAI